MDRATRRRLILQYADSSPWTPAALASITAGWWEADAVTLNGSNVASMADKGPGGHPLANATSQPPYSATGNPGGGPMVQFNGSTWLFTDAITYGRPQHIVLCASIGVGTGNATLVDGRTGNTMRTFAVDSTQKAKTYASSFGPEIDYTRNTWLVLDVLFATGTNAAKIGINGGTPVAGTLGVEAAAGGVTLGASGSAGSEKGVCNVYGLFAATRALTDAERMLFANYFRAKVGY